MIQRGGEVCIQRLENVQQKTMEPLIKKALIPDTLIYTDEYNIYGRLEAWGYPMPWFIMARVNSHGMTIKMAFVKCMSIP